VAYLTRAEYARLPCRKLWLDNAGLDWSHTTHQVAEFLENQVKP
jgi:hypothetical protein